MATATEYLATITFVYEFRGDDRTIWHCILEMNSIPLREVIKGTHIVLYPDGYFVPTINNKQQGEKYETLKEAKAEVERYWSAYLEFSTQIMLVTDPQS